MRTLLLLCAIILFGACEKDPKTNPPQSTAPNSSKSKKADGKVFILKDINGTKVDIKIEGNQIESSIQKPLVLLFFYTDWCPSCKAQKPELKRLYQTFSHDLFILGVPLEPTQTKAPFFQSLQIDQNNRLAQAIYPTLGAGANMPIPLLVLLKNGRYYRHYVGAVPYEILQSDIKSAKGE
ncbi:MAG: hypothetical protein C6H99_03130 [Epsilonproteobacteria bacterium]|nr:hypothetical protein [Campylobacterota bacterium]NPA63454.1 thioredoxin family protein [Campylobacterota bacterium]